VSCVVVQPSWQDVLDEVALATPPTAPFAPGTTQLFWQSDTAELHLIMQLVTVDVTVDVSGTIGVNCVCAAATVTPIPNANPATATTIAKRRMIASQIALRARRIIAQRR
jgi:hypothetical protein